MYPRPKPRFVPSPEPPRDDRDRYYTCGKCGVIGEWRNLLDEKPICYLCLREARFGKHERECKERGYHMTEGVSSWGPVWHDWFEVCVRCKCGVEWRKNMPGAKVQGGTTTPDFTPPEKWTIKKHELVGVA